MGICAGVAVHFFRSVVVTRIIAVRLAALLGLTLVLFYLHDGWQYFAPGKNDYLSFYAGARLVESSNLYHPRQSFAVEMAAAGFYGESLEYTRLPFYAVLLWPLGRLPYLQSYWVWQGLSIAALVGFVLAWQVTSRDWTVLACCWSLPLLLGIAHGQDLTFLLLLLAVSLRIHSDRPFTAGALLSLCSIKFNLFLLLPLLIVGQRRWRMLAGLLAGGAALAAVSFAAAGGDWPRRYVEILSMSSISPQEQIMPNFHGMLVGFRHGRVLEMLLDIVAAGVTWLVARRYDFSLGMGAVLVGGLLVSHHAYPQDCTLLIPALLILMSRRSWWFLNYLCIALFTPWPYLLLIQGDPFNLVRTSIVALDFLLYPVTRRRVRSAQPQ